MIQYTVRVSDPSGNRLATFANFIEDGGPALDYVLSVGKVGVLVLTQPFPPTGMTPLGKPPALPLGTHTILSWNGD